MDIEKMKAEAAAIHTSGFNCAQSVLCACREYTGLDDKQALAIAGPFGAGAACGELCGAISGALMAVGTVKPFTDSSDPTAKPKIMKLSKTISDMYKAEFGCVRCAELKAKRVSCARLIDFGVEAAVKVIEEN